MKISPVCGGHLLLPKTVLVGPPYSPPLMAMLLRVTCASPLWSGSLLCNCALTPPCGGSSLSFPGPALVRSYRQGLPGLWGSCVRPYTLWRCYRSTRPRHVYWHINCLKLLAVHLAMGRLNGLLRGKHVLVCTDNTATVAYINRQGGLHSCPMSELARHLLLWTQKHLRSLRAVHVPGVLIRVADCAAGRVPGEWQLHPQVVQLIWGEFGETQVDLFASPETSHCQLFYSLSSGTLSTYALVHSWPRGLRNMRFPQ